MIVRAACCQFAPQKGRVDANLDRIADAIVQASEGEVDLLLFPETAVTGYFLEGGVVELALEVTELMSELSKRLAGRLHRAIDVAVGFYESAQGILYNAAAYFEFGANESRLVHAYHKFFLPTYGVFDEERFVARGQELGVFNTRFGKVGMLICEDVWHSILPTLSAINGAQILLVPSASPARGFQSETIGNLDRYARMLRSLCEEHGIFALHAMLTGFEGGKGFVGGSRIVGPDGKTLASSPILEDHLLVADLDMDLIEIARNQSPLISDLRSAWSDLRRIVDESP